MNYGMFLEENNYFEEAFKVSSLVEMLNIIQMFAGF